MSKRELLIGVSGGVAAFKTAAVVSQLVKDDFGVTVVMTQSATQFIGVATFAALTNRDVYVDAFDEKRFPLGPHIELASQADLLCVAPATANFLGKTAHGIADDLLSTLYLSFAGPVLMAPAMNCEMWAKPSVARNVKQLREDGVKFIDPEEGWLACRTRGMGRMAENERILKAITDGLDNPLREGDE